MKGSLQLRFLILSTCLLFVVNNFNAQQSVARMWNEMVLEGIRHDYARPTVHARNLFHTSVVMYDAWAAYDSIATPYMLGKTVHGFTMPFNGVDTPQNIQAAREEAISYAAYRMIKHRFVDAPGDSLIFAKADSLMDFLGYDKNMISWDYVTGPPGALGNYIAAFMINYGYQDGSNEANTYANQYYEPINPSLILADSGNPNIVDPNRWQPLTFDVFIDQSGNVILGATPKCLSPEWGDATTFSMPDEDSEVLVREGHNWRVYHNPGPPPMLDTTVSTTGSDYYKWTFSLVSKWSSHLSPDDGVMIDISPASIGNITDYPTDFADYPNFYDEINGGDPGTGYSINPITNLPYESQVVHRGDYTRVLAEFWADGPNSETPPGHWFVIANHVNDHPALQKRFMGEGDVLDDLEWDVKLYFALGGAMHDAAIAAWSIKGYYDYVRPISAIRYMADRGQSSDPNALSYHVAGIPLEPGLIELVLPGDSLALLDSNNIGKIKVYAWRGHDYVENTAVDEAGVGWILAEDWWPYQRPSFVTPPFPGYVSGHSTYSRTAAELLSLFTGSEYFPGGIGQFPALQDEFLVFEDGPSQTIILQWAKYFDASDQCSLSRIWGGIHPPADDINGRRIGMVLGPEAFEFAKTHFINLDTVDTGTFVQEVHSGIKLRAYPNPVSDLMVVNGELPVGNYNLSVVDVHGRIVLSQRITSKGSYQSYGLYCGKLPNGVYTMICDSGTDRVTEPLRFVKQ
ncbi:MAG: T9SS type A sorting domain-containing protein [Flavobacteriales bacterium]